MKWIQTPYYWFFSQVEIYPVWVWATPATCQQDGAGGQQEKGRATDMARWLLKVLHAAAVLPVASSWGELTCTGMHESAQIFTKQMSLLRPENAKNNIRSSQLAITGWIREENILADCLAKTRQTQRARIIPKEIKMWNQIKKKQQQKTKKLIYLFSSSANLEQNRTAAPVSKTKRNGFWCD